MVTLERIIDKYIGALLILCTALLDIILRILLFPIKLLSTQRYREQHKEQNQHKQLYENSPIKNILIIKLWAAGDSVVSLPMIKAIKTRLPKSRITVLARKRNKEVFEACKYVDRIILFEDFAEVMRTIRKYDAVIDLEPYLNISALLAYYSGKERIGLGKQLRSILYTKKTIFTGKKHFAQVYLDMARAIGINYDTDELVELIVPEKDAKNAEKLLKANEIKKKDIVYGICIGVAESVKSREWPPERFAKLADSLIGKHCDKIIFLGTSAEKSMVEGVISKMSKKNKALNLAGKTTLKEAFHIIKKCKVFISNDTGPMHIAAAQGCRTIGLFGPNTPVLWAPYGKSNKAIYKGPAVCKYSPCIRNIKGYMPKCRLGINKCMRAISVKDVLNAVNEISK